MRVILRPQCSRCQVFNNSTICGNPPNASRPGQNPQQVSKTIDSFIEKSIDIPKIVVALKGKVTAGYRDFELDLKGVHLPPVAKDILIAHLHDQARYRLISGDGIAAEARLEDYLVRGLVDFDDVSYDDHSELLYKLAGAVVRHLQSYLSNEDDVRNVLTTFLRPRNARMSTACSATMCFSWWFSSSNCRSRFASLSSIPPYLDFHR